MRHTYKFIIIFFIIISFSFAEDNKFLINLDHVKKAIREYYTEGQYDRETDKAIDDALISLSNLDIPKNAAFVFDVDETALSNMSYELQYDFAYIPPLWDIWVDSAKATAIPQVKRFYDSLVSKGISIIFLTGRHHNFYDMTVQNLKNEGYTKFDTLICRAPKFKGTKAVEYKNIIRKELSKKYKIIGSIGDQWSDSEGDNTILKIKIPNYMYYIE